MKTFTFLLCFLLNAIYSTKAQQIRIAPEVLIGHRAAFYKQDFMLQCNERIFINTNAVYDADFRHEQKVLYFLRNAVSYTISKSTAISLAHGVKNPGTFGTVAVQYSLSDENLLLISSVGLTYLHSFTIEPFVLVEYNGAIASTTQFYFRFQAVVNISVEAFTRGIQQVRVGISNGKMKYGIGGNFDQFLHAETKLENIGLFFKYQL